ncbi:MAG: c-type cytochrome [Candidatus Acidiferrales bacterium]
MKVLILIACALALATLTGAQTGGPAGQAGAQFAPGPQANVVPLPSIQTLNPSQAAGKKLFVQRCSICHLPALPSYTAYGPLLSGKLVAKRGEDFERQHILKGSALMPGFQYTLSAKEIDEIVEYLKTLPDASGRQ